MQKNKRLDKKWIAHVNVTLKEGLLDPQGKAVLGALQSFGFSEIGQVWVGRYIRLACQGKSKETVHKAIDAACHKLLANPVIEKYTISIES